MSAVPTPELIDRFFSFASAVASRTATSVDDEAVSIAHQLSKIPAVQGFIDDWLDALGGDIPEDAMSSVSVPADVMQSVSAAGVSLEKFIALLPILIELFKQLRAVRNG